MIKKSSISLGYQTAFAFISDNEHFYVHLHLLIVCEVLQTMVKLHQ